MLLYSGPLSLFARKTEIALAEKSIPFDRVVVSFSQTRGYAPKHPAVVAANPKGQVPVLVDGDLTLYDSTVIIEYLEDAYPAHPLLPAEPVARARCRLMELEADEVLLVPVRALMHRTEPPGPDTARRLLQEQEAAKAEDAILVHYGKISAKLSGQEFLCGDFSLADIATFMVMHYALRLGGPPLASHPNLSAWYARLAERPAFAAVVAEIAAADRELSHPVPPYRKTP
ncbi:MAG: glutathione S-transferase family protein [Rhizobiales bacterium]|nr:glutathione S-transferase family protein [Hyphomicrobiales bacterium]